MKKILIATLLLFLSTSALSHPKKCRKHIKHHCHITHKKQTVVNTTHVNVILINTTDNALIGGSLDSSKVSIASISKLMTIYTVLKNEQNFNEKLTVKTKLQNHTRLAPGMTLTRGDLVKLSLVHSDNLAAITLSENFLGGQPSFINAMNKNAKELGMTNTEFHEPTGLNANNSSTLHDIVLLTNAVSKFETFRQAAKTENLVIYATRGNKHLTIKANPTSKFFGREGVVTIKTGFTNAAGFCITMLVFADNKLYNLVILGARSSNERKIIIEKSLQTIHNS
jgi:D-alanyl-D-alanine endopeptidase (penicillin-binding protein 7)